ncbi:MAG TPA: large conductance mechanosensitive channel protein MscL [Candidatus Paceibacterota bacterium]|nr:large conductance mechanosensitive channel protein MscL [Candidatus Paceibacterota bacterium]
MIKGFRDFILRGNVVDLAVGVVIGAAFSAVVSGLVKDLVTPLIAAIFTQPDFSSLMFTVNGSKFMYGDFINAVITFFIDAFAIYFFVVLPVNKLLARFKGPAPEVPSTKACPFCKMSDLAPDATRCPHCTSTLTQ